VLLFYHGIGYHCGYSVDTRLNTFLCNALYFHCQIKLNVASACGTNCEHVKQAAADVMFKCIQQHGSAMPRMHYSLRDDYTGLTA